MRLGVVWFTVFLLEGSVAVMDARSTAGEFGGLSVSFIIPLQTHASVCSCNLNFIVKGRIFPTRLDIMSPVMLVMIMSAMVIVNLYDSVCSCIAKRMAPALASSVAACGIVMQSQRLLS